MLSLLYYAEQFITTLLYHYSYSFEVLRGRTLYRKANLNSILKNGLAIGPLIDEYEPVFRFDSTKEEDDIYDEDDYEPFPDTEE